MIWGKLCDENWIEKGNERKKWIRVRIDDIKKVEKGVILEKIIN